MPFCKSFAKPVALLCLLLTLNLTGYGQAPAAGGIKGFVYDDQGKPLPFATIYVKQTETGTATNIEGYYELSLPPGVYTIVFQYLGYAAREREFTIGSELQPVNINLEPEALVLQDVEINARMEDPAYTIMRKAIAKSKYHLQQIDSYQARVYIKGSGRLLDSPFFLRRQLAKEGIDSTFTYVSESISEISYKRPNTFAEKVIYVRSSGDDNGTSPNGYVMGSFYEPTIAESVSPLSPRAFAYYKFEYLGTFTDRGYEISKIKVTPRSVGDDVFAGIINIVEGYWSIYSLDLTTTKLGIEFRIRQIYNPINEVAWLPVSHKFDVAGTFMGFEFEYFYLATVSDYNIALNPDLKADLVVIDEKVDRELAAELAAKSKHDNSPARQKLAEGKEVSRKELRKLINEYEKEQLREAKEPRVVENYSYAVDSLAANSDSAFWQQVRPVPLTEREVLGYKKMDSLVVVEQEKEAEDSLKNARHKGFQVQDILFGDTYLLKNNDRLRYYSPLAALNFNTVEGYNFNIRFRYRHNFSATSRLELIPVLRYSFTRNLVSGMGTINYGYNRRSVREGLVSLSGGKFVQQLNNANPIHPLVNTITTLLLQSNYMKIYEAGFISLAHQGKITDNLGYALDVTWSERTNLTNNTTHTWIRQGKEYTPNNPANAEVADTGFPFHQSLTGEISLIYRPWQRYRIRNKRKIAITSSSPAFSLLYRKGFATGISATDFDYLEAGIKHNFKLGVRGRLGFDFTAGRFLTAKNLYFIDFKHFAGNETPFLLNNPVGGYRLLSYYNYSTAQEFFSALTYYQFRKFLFTQLPVLRLTGVKELVFFNYLATPFSNNYFEFGYGLDNLFRILRLEAAVSFQDGRYLGFGVKIGIATSFTTGDESVSFEF